ncbi:response regulator transcription factor [Sulfurovum sp. ST-21]|uniref:Response regulator transcription factor n=1 Tax=Sulfurovum indicum TaxID=2779528 RepID=A0A7M1S1E0_9BACT|nr:response regulator [Sulfurovum indicum]QOR61285.1 response regulator transcription factor [Sulfurovum indicum]
MKILIINHEYQSNTEIEKELKHRSFSTNYQIFATFNKNKTDMSSYDLVLLDVPLMSDESYMIIKKIRASDKHIPIIVLSPFYQIRNIEKCFIFGCNDYLKKPVVIDELIFKLNFWLNFKTYQNTQTIRLKNGFSYDPGHHELLKDKIPISLTAKEKLFIEILVKNRGWFVPTPTIIRYLWDNYAAPNQLRVLVYKLRQKAGKELITSMKGIGYKIDPESVKKTIWRAERRKRSAAVFPHKR